MEQKPDLGAKPSYASVWRFMKAHGLCKRPRRGPANSPGAREAERREVRSYENEYVNGLWHLDFHHGSLAVVLENGRWVYRILLGILDDHSRLCCHAQWYLAEGGEELCHGSSQALQKRGLPRALMSDNGSAMLAGETEQGLLRSSGIGGRGAEFLKRLHYFQSLPSAFVKNFVDSSRLGASDVIRKNRCLSNRNSVRYRCGLLAYRLSRQAFFSFRLSQADSIMLNGNCRSRTSVASPAQQLSAPALTFREASTRAGRSPTLPISRSCGHHTVRKLMAGRFL